MKNILLALVFVFGLNVVPAQAWSRNGHMIIAAMTYRALPDALQQSYTELLREHPDYIKWEKEYQSLQVDIELGEFLFMKASIWPDEIRRQGSVYDHPTWHYTNFPVIPDDFPMEETLTPENDVIFAVNESRRVLSDSSSSVVDQAAHLSWILHTIGDMHQPLHSVALVNEKYPQGDRGGNLFFVRPRAESKGVNLHRYWDGLLGTNGKVRDARNDATMIWQALSDEASAQISAQIDVRSWALEGRVVAIASVYLNGELEGTVEERKEAAVILPEAYGKQAKSIAQKRAVLASLRLLQVLSES